MSVKSLLIFILLAAALVACVPTKQGSMQATCGENQAFDPVKRTCYSVYIPPLPPSATLDNVNIAGETATPVTLTYTDNKKELARFCSVTSGASLSNTPCLCVQGVCKTTLTSAYLFYGQTTFTYTVTDNDGTSAAHTVTVNVSAKNYAPVTSSVTRTVVEDVLSSALTASASDVNDWDTLTYELVSSPSYAKAGTFYLNPVLGTFSYQGSAYASDNDRFAYTTIQGLRYVAKTLGTSGNLINVTYVHNAVPSVSVSGNAITVYVNSGVTTGAQVQALIAASPAANALVSTYLLGSIPQTTAGSTFLSGGRALTDSFTFRARDTGLLYSNTSTVTMTITPVNNAPTLGSNQSISATHGTLKSFTLNLGSDIDKLDELIYTAVTPVAYGTLVGCLGGTTSLNCSYTPNAGVSDDDRYARIQIGGLYYVAKNYGVYGNNITVEYIADAASAGSETVSVSGYAITVHISADGKTTSQQIKTAIANNYSANALVGTYLRGSIYEVAQGPVTLAGGRPYTDTFSYKVNDGTVDSSSTASVTFSVTSSNSAPSFGSVLMAETLTEDTPATFDMISATDVNPFDTVLYTVVTPPAHGTLSGCLSGTSILVCTYTPEANYSGADSFTYKAVDNNGAVAAQTVTVNLTINPVDDLPKICRYTSFEEANECGEDGCVGTVDPTGVITPKDGLYYYNTAKVSCWKSSSSAWTEVTNSTLADQTINEKDQIIIDHLKIDEGGSGSESTQTLTATFTVTKISGDNGLIVDSNVFLYYDTATVTPGVTVISAGAGVSEGTKDFKMVVVPVSGKVGTAQVALTIEDSDGATSTQSFLVTVNPTSIQHKGWADVVAIGPKISKDADLLSPVYPCNYSRYHCTIDSKLRQNCTGSFIPSSTTASTSEQYAIFYNSSLGTCYYNSAASGASANWVEFKSVCNVSSSYGYGLTGKASLVGTSSPVVAGIVPQHKNDFYYDLTAKLCYRSTGTTLASQWDTYNQTSQVTISWEDFLVSGSGSITGYNIYRALAGDEFNYKRPINKNIISSASSYVDNASNSWIAPVPKTAYKYEVRPVVNGISTDADGYSQTINVVTPPENMALVHRWIANKTMCKKLHYINVDTLNNYRCAYQGPGDNGAGYYDIGKDFFVDVYEAGCNYSSSDICDTAEGTCVGLNSPVGTVTADVSSGPARYYERGTGLCYSTSDGTTWSVLNGTQSFAHNYPKLPPAVHLTQVQANTFCSAQSVGSILGVAGSATGTLPNRKLQMVYSDWSSSLSSTAITTYEAGQALNSSAKCNANAADGLTSLYSDADIPDSSSFYTLPGTITSGIRSFITGSDQTVTCKSRFGVQDAVGNVAEWVQDRFKCTQLGVCEGVVVDTPEIPLLDASLGMQGKDTSGNFVYKIGDRLGPYGGTYPSGPCNDVNGDGYCSSFLASWLFEETEYSAGRLWVPMGLPGNSNFTSSMYPDSQVVPWLFLIGNSSGIEDEDLHNDQVLMNTQNIYSDMTSIEYGCGSMAVGGSYTSSSKSAQVSPAGVYNFELVPCKRSYGYLLIGDVSFKSKVDLNAEPVYIEFVTAGAESATVTDVGTTHSITVGITASSTASSIKATVNAQADVKDLVYADVAGVPTRVQSDLSSTEMEDTSTASASRVDIGFRCAYPLP